MKGGFAISSNVKNVMFAFAALLIVLIVIALFVPSGNKVSNTPVETDFMSDLYTPYEGFANDSAKVMLFHATWCGHCVKYIASGTFDKVAALPEVSGVTFEKYDADKNEDVRDKYDVTSFPTIIGLNSKGDKVEFSGDRDNTADLIRFAKSLM